MSDLASVITNTVNGAINTANTAVNTAVNAVNVGIAQINAALTGPSTLNFAYGKTILGAPVGPGVVINLPSNTDSQLALSNPLQFQGTINLNVPGYTPQRPALPRRPRRRGGGPLVVLHQYQRADAVRGEPGHGHAEADAQRGRLLGVRGAHHGGRGAFRRGGDRQPRPDRRATRSGGAAGHRRGVTTLA